MHETWKNLIFTQVTIQNISAAKYNYLTIPLPPLDEISDTEHYIAEQNLWAFLQATQSDTIKKLA